MVSVKIMSSVPPFKVLYENTPPVYMAAANQAVLLGWAIKNALKSGANLRDANLSAANLSAANLRRADLRRSDLGYANLHDANLRGADLGYANLGYADLSDANLRDANLSAANLIDADLRGADLRGASMRFASMRGAILDGAVLSDVMGMGYAEIPLLPNIDAAILEAVEKDRNKLDMNLWHTCKTTHCRAGWAIHLCGEAGYALEKAVGSSAAGALIYAKSRPGKPVPNFTAPAKDAIADMRACAAEAAEQNIK